MSPLQRLSEKQQQQKNKNKKKPEGCGLIKKNREFEMCIIGHLHSGD